MLLVPLLDPAGVGGCHCLPHPERLIANQEYRVYTGRVKKLMPFGWNSTISMCTANMKWLMIVKVEFISNFL